MTADTRAPAATLSPAATREQLATGAVLRWWQTTAIVEAAGPDATSLLDGLCTQAIDRIAEGHARMGLFLDAKAKIIAPAVIHRLTDVDGAARFAMETPADRAEALHDHVRRYRLRAKVSLAIDSGSCAIALVGSDADDLADARDDADRWTSLEDAVRPMRTLVADAATCAEALATFTDRFADPDAFEADRIEARNAGLYDLLTGRMPAEVGGMDRAVALDAGCYLGQEPVARLHWRGHANRTLRLIRAVDSSPFPAIDSSDDDARSLRRIDDPAGGRPKGQVTSWATSEDGAVVALAMVRRELEVGDELVLMNGSGPRFRVEHDADA